MRKVIKKRYIDKIPIFGGAGYHIEADESLFNRRDEEAKEDRWVFGVLERES